MCFIVQLLFLLNNVIILQDSAIRMSLGIFSRIQTCWQPRRIIVRDRYSHVPILLLLVSLLHYTGSRERRTAANRSTYSLVDYVLHLNVLLDHLSCYIIIIANHLLI